MQWPLVEEEDEQEAAIEEDPRAGEKKSFTSPSRCPKTPAPYNIEPSSFLLYSTLFYYNVYQHSFLRGLFSTTSRTFYSYSLRLRFPGFYTFPSFDTTWLSVQMF